MSMEDQEGISQAASALAKLSAQKRKARMGQAKFTEHMRQIARLPRRRKKVAKEPKSE